jgi:3-(3-hydroxy-phenyl)propionate hydroxylase
MAIVERRPTPALVGSRAGGFHSRTIEILDQRGIADRFLAEGTRVQAAFCGNTTLDVSDSGRRRRRAKRCPQGCRHRVPRWT